MAVVFASAGEERKNTAMLANFFANCKLVCTSRRGQETVRTFVLPRCIRKGKRKEQRPQYEKGTEGGCANTFVFSFMKKRRKQLRYEIKEKENIKIENHTLL